MREKIKHFFLLLIFVSSIMFADVPAIQSYRRQFFMGDLQEKILVLENASRDSEMQNDIGRLYALALEFSMNSEYEKDDPNLLRLINIALNGLSHSYQTYYSESLDALWRLFWEYIDTPVGVDALLTIGKVAGNDFESKITLYDFLVEQNMNFRNFQPVNYNIISASISTIIELGDDNFFPVLLDIIHSNYPEIITFEAYEAIELLQGDFLSFLLNVIENEVPAKKILAFQIGRESTRLSQSELGQLAELAFEKSFTPDLDELRYAAALILTSLRWTRAGPLAVRHFYRVQTDFQHGVVPKERFIEAIELLGAVGGSDAALALGLQLGLINNRTRRTGEFDEEITYAIVRALGLTGDRGAFEHLLTVTYLSYPSYIQTAARESINQTRW